MEIERDCDENVLLKQMDYTNAIEDYVMPDDHNEKTLTKLEFKGYRGISSKL